MNIVDPVMGLVDGITRKKLDQVKDPKVRDYLTNVWGDLLVKTPSLFEALVGPGEVILSGEYLDKTKAIMASIQGDIMAFKNKEIGESVFKDLIRRRKSAIFSLYNAQKIQQAKPSVQKVLIAASQVAEILLKHGIPVILALI